ncbi:hypothetical protein NBG84_20835 [Streptomyces sp. CWNU-1]|uniref:Integral membrane protein n=2 Tax=Streptomyces albipurpureus TaxID=2897419 RepID=A0ABT0UU25_9ACTN|nr:hypothetical protein [Streptomyces sp. CWNU-1]
MGAVRGVWRWRGNPLRRATDLIEAWVALIAALLLVTLSPAIGWLVGSATEDSLRQSMRLQRQQRHPTTATVLSPAPPAKPPSYDPDATASHRQRGAVRAQWRAVDGQRRTGTVSTVLAKPRAGDRITIWTDAQGHAVGRPLNGTTVRTHAALTGVGGALTAAGTLECARRLVLWRLVRRRYERLDRAWAAVGPDWGRTGTGS